VGLCVQVKCECENPEIENAHPHFNHIHTHTLFGEMAEWLNAAVL